MSEATSPVLSQPYDLAAAELAVAGRRLALPKGPQRGRVGAVSATSVGSALEFHDFRHYQPGDDLRHIDYNVVARTGEWILRIRENEVAPRVELLLDASRSMAISGVKAARAKELAHALGYAAIVERLDLALLVAAEHPSASFGRMALPALGPAQFDGREHLGLALRRLPALRTCGLRVVVSDFLFETDLSALCARLRKGASALHLVQTLAAADTELPQAALTRLVDLESGQALDRMITESLITSFSQRLQQHQRALALAAQRAGASLMTVDCQQPIDALVRERLGELLPLSQESTRR